MQTVQVLTDAPVAAVGGMVLLAGVVRQHELHMNQIKRLQGCELLWFLKNNTYYKNRKNKNDSW